MKSTKVIANLEKKKKMKPVLITFEQQDFVKCRIMQFQHFLYSPDLLFHMTFFFPKQKIHLKTKISGCGEH